MKKGLSINTLAKSSIKHRKKQYTIMIIGILLAMIFSSTVLFFVSSIFTSMQETTKVNYGDFDRSFYGAEINDSYYAEAKKSGVIEDYAYIHVIGKIYPKTDDENLYTPIAYLDEKSKEFYYASFLEGGYPTAPGQIALEKATLDILAPDAVIGDKITVFMRGQNAADLLDEYVEKNFELVGIIRNKKSNMAAIQDFTHNDDLVATAFVFDESDGVPGSKTADLAYIKEGSMPWYDFTTEIMKSGLCDYSHIPYFEGDAYYTDTFFFMVIGFVFCVILLLASFIGIINAMNSNFADRKKQIGMLRTVGATKRQIRKIFGREAIIISLICAPIALLGAYLLVKLIAIFYGDNFYFVLNFPILILSVIFGVVCVIIASAVPLRSASKISPVQSIRNIEITRQMKTKHIKSKTHFDVSKLLANRNVRFYRKKQIVVSFFMIITIFVSCYGYSWIEYEIEHISTKPNDYELSTGYAFGKYNSNIRSMSGKIDENMKQEVFDISYISNVTAVKKAVVMLEQEELSDYTEFLNSHSEFEITKKTESAIQNYCKTDKKLVGMYIIAMDKSSIESLKASVTDGEINFEALDSGNEVLLSAPDKIAIYKDTYGDYIPTRDENIEADKSYDFIFERDINVGDNLTANCLFADWSKDNNIKNVELYKNDVKVGGYIRDVPYEINRLLDYPGYAFLITTCDGFDNLIKENVGYYNMGATLKDKYRQNMTDEIDEEIMNRLMIISARTGGDGHYSSNYAAVKSQMSEYTSVLLAVIAVMILLVAGSMSIINNSLTARIRESKREIGTLRAVGATQKDLTMSYIRQLLSMFGWGTSMGFGIFFATYLGMYIYCKINKTVLELSFSVMPAVIATVILFAVCSLNLYFKIKKETKNSIIDNIREL